MSKKTCLIGYGYWGKNILRNLTELKPSAHLVLVEPDIHKTSGIRKAFPDMKIEVSPEAALASDVEAVIIATPTKFHYMLAKQALLAGKHLLVEKPITTSLAETEELAEISSRQGLVLMVDHIYLYHPVVRKMKEYFTDDFLGRINYLDSTRINLGIYQNDVNVLWDLACHDIAIVNFLIGEKPEAVSVTGRLNPEWNIEDIAYTFLYYPSGLLVQINSSWASPVKIRKMIVGGEKRMLIYDDIDPINKLTIYEYEHDTARDENKSRLTEYRLGNIVIPKFEQSEALKNALNDFFHAISAKTNPLSDSRNAIEVVRILEKAQESLKNGGVKLSLH